MIELIKRFTDHKYISTQQNEFKCEKQENVKTTKAN